MKRVINMLTILFFVLSINSLSTSETYAEEFTTEAESAILVDYETGKILFEKNADDLLPSASMSKMLTEYIVLEAIENGDFDWNTKTKISDYGHWISTNNDFSGIALNKEIEYTVEELFHGLAVYSDNAAVITLMELITDTEAEYLEIMREKAKELGLSSSEFVNATGINNESLEGRHPKGTDPKATNQMTARDLAILGYRLITDYPVILDIANQPSIEFHGTTLPNWNWMLKFDSPYLSQFYYEGIDGIKTGSSSEAGYGFTSTVEREGKRYLAVIMKAKNKGDHFIETKKLYDYAYHNFERETVDLNQFNHVVKVENGEKETVKIEFKEEIELPKEKGTEPDYKLDLKLADEHKQLEAPINKDEKVGKASIKNDDDKYGYLLSEFTEKQTVDAYLAETIEKKSLFLKLKQALFSIFS